MKRLEAVVPDTSPKPERGIRRGRMSPFAAGVLAIVAIAIGTFFGFTHYNPLDDPYTFTATFHSANEVQAGSPVRVAGGYVGEGAKGRHERGGTRAPGGAMGPDHPAPPLKADAARKNPPRP